MSSKFLSSALTAGLFVFLNACSFDSDNISSRVVVKVNGQKLLSKEFAENVANKLKVFDAYSLKDPSIVNKAKDEVIHDFIVKVITEDWARENNVFVRQEDLDKEIVRVRTAYPDDLSFRRALAKENLSFKAWKEKLHFSILEKLVTKKLNEQIQAPTDEEVESHYKANKSEYVTKDMVKLRQIILDSESNAKRVRNELRKGKAFKGLANRYSIGPEADNNGETGWIEKDSLKVFDAAFNMRTGQISNILKSPYGFHIYSLIDKKKAKKLSLKEAKETIKQRLIEKRQKALYSSWLEKQLRKAQVFEDEIFIKELKVETRGS